MRRTAKTVGTIFSASSLKWEERLAALIKSVLRAASSYLRNQVISLQRELLNQEHPAARVTVPEMVQSNSLKRP